MWEKTQQSQGAEIDTGRTGKLGSRRPWTRVPRHSQRHFAASSLPRRAMLLSRLFEAIANDRRPPNPRASGRTLWRGPAIPSAFRPCWGNFLSDLPMTEFRALARLPDTFLSDDAGLTFAFKEGWRGHSRLCDRRLVTEGGRQRKSGGMKVDKNRLEPQSKGDRMPEPAAALVPAT